MTTLTHETFQTSIKEEYEQLNTPTGTPRRIGAEEGAGMWEAIGTLDGIYELLDEGTINLEKATVEITDALLELASSLYSAGAEHQLWRHWISLTAFGMFLTGQIHQAAQYAVLGGEWDFLKVLPPKPVTSQQLSEQVLWTVVGGQPVPTLSTIRLNREDKAWLQLVESIPSNDHVTIQEALKTIADFWIAELEDWMNYSPGNYPDFHPQACAAAALARHNGFIPTSFTPEQYNFLEAGLAEPEPPPMFPRHFSLPASSTAATG